jgi:hypothetical protein
MVRARDSEHGVGAARDELPNRNCPRGERSRRCGRSLGWVSPVAIVGSRWAARLGWRTGYEDAPARAGRRVSASTVAA